MVVTLEEAKAYLKMDDSDDDALILALIQAATEICEDILRYPLSEFTEIPETVKQAGLFAIGNFFEQRETLNMQEMITFMARLLFAYRKGGW